MMQRRSPVSTKEKLPRRLPGSKVNQHASSPLTKIPTPSGPKLCRYRRGSPLACPEKQISPRTGQKADQKRGLSVLGLGTMLRGCMTAGQLPAKSPRRNPPERVILAFLVPIGRTDLRITKQREAIKGKRCSVPLPGILRAISPTKGWRRD